MAQGRTSPVKPSTSASIEKDLGLWTPRRYREGPLQMYFLGVELKHLRLTLHWEIFNHSSFWFFTPLPLLLCECLKNRKCKVFLFEQWTYNRSSINAYMKA